MSGSDPTDGTVPKDDSYVSRTGQKEANVPVTSDDDIRENEQTRENADSDAQLEKDEKDAINKDNIINERTRGAAHSKGSLAEPGDEEGLPGPDDGTSRVAQ